MKVPVLLENHHGTRNCVDVDLVLLFRDRRVWIEWNPVPPLIEVVGETEKSFGRIVAHSRRPVALAGKELCTLTDWRVVVA